MTNVANPKLNALHVLNHIETLISKMEWSAVKRFKICLFEDRIQIIPAKEETPPEFCFLEFAESDLRKGFTGGQWDKILNKASVMIAKEVLCREHLKL